MKLYLVVGLGVLVLIQSSCASRQQSPADSISLSMKDCIGGCPFHSMTVFSDGRYEWRSDAHGESSGLRRGRFPSAVYGNAAQTVEAAEIGTFQDKYDGSSCARWKTDHPTIIIEVRKAAYNKKIAHYLGCEGFDGHQQLVELEGDLQEILRVEKFAR